jgi:DNA-binding response OmpR family regulator
MTRVLVVDDDEQSRRLVRRALGQMPGAEVMEAGDGEEGLDMAHQRRPDVILLDIKMPNMDGIEFLKRSSRDEFLSNVPVRMVTAVSDRQQIIVSVSYGARDYVVKPFDPIGLVNKIKRLLADNAMR